MTSPKYVLVAHTGHDAPWLQIKTRKEVRERRAYIKTDKPAREVPLRLKLLKIVKEPLPRKLRKAYAALGETYAALGKAYAASGKAYAAWEKADAAREKADAAREKIINSPEGVAFHKKVCGCAWSPKQPDILRQLK